MKAIVLDKIGGPDVLTVSDIDKPKIKDNEVLVKIKYAGINYAELMSRRGMYSWAPKRPYILGLEAAGEVVEVGSKIKTLAIGDRVFIGTQQGSYAEYIAIEGVYALPIPDFYSWEEAASFGVTFFTSWIGLQEMARVRSGEVLLVHAAAGGVGSAAVLLGKALGMEVYGTASESKRKVVEDLGATYFTYDNFDKELMKLGKAPNCVIETIGGDVFRRSFQNLAPMGRVVLIGASGIQLNKWNPISLFKAWRALPKATIKDVIRASRGFMGLHVGYMINRQDILLPAWAEMIKVIEEHKLRPLFRDDQIFPMSRAGDAHQYMHDRKNIGKILLDPTK